MGSSVGLVSVQSTEKDIKRSISEALALIGFKFGKHVSSVVIKPNLCYYWDAYTGYTTDPRIVSGIVDCIRASCGEDLDIKIAESDATAMRTKHAFRMLGYEELAKEKRIRLINLSKAESEEIATSVSGREIMFKVPCLLLGADLFVNVPKMKVMRETNITCAMKNVFGCISSPRKIAYHPFLNEAIVGINKILHPHLNIVDGLVALGRCPVNLGLIAASDDVFSVDWTASRIMGYDPSRIEFLRTALDEKVGTREGIIPLGEDVALLREKFPTVNMLRSKWAWRVQLGLLKWYHRITGDLIPPALEEI